MSIKEQKNEKCNNVFQLLLYEKSLRININVILLDIERDRDILLTIVQYTNTLKLFISPDLSPW